MRVVYPFGWRLDFLKFHTTAALAGAVFMIAGCGCGGTQAGTDNNSTSQLGNPSGGSGTGQKTGKAIKVGIVFDSGGRGDKSFNDSAWRGVEMAMKDFNIGKPNGVESKQAKDYETNLDTLASAGYDLVFAVGISQNKALETVAAKYPNVKFAIVDAVVDKPNVRSLTFTEQEGSFLAGYLAGLMTKSNKIGFVGGQQLDLIKKFQYGYQAGAKTANPDVEILPAKYTDSWDDIDKGKAAANVLFSSGADIVYSAAGRCGLGVINAAKDAGKYAIGVDSDQDDVAKGTVLTSMIKRVDNAVYNTIKDTVSDKFTPGQKIYSLKDNGVGLSEMKNTKDKIGKDNLAKIDAISAKIKDGSIKVPATEAEYNKYLATLKK